MVALLLKPRFWPGHLAMLVCVALAVGLGLWQYDAWGHRRDDAARNLANVPAVPLSSVMTGDSAFPGQSQGRPVSFSGSWLGKDTMYVSDQDLGKRRGYWVVTPVLVAGSSTHSAIPVVRGWTTKPDAPAPSGDVDVTGWLQASDDDDGPVDPDPYDDVIPTMRIASLVQHVNADLYSGYIVAKVVSAPGQGGATTATSGLEPVKPAAVPDVSSFTALRNLLYGIEWWVFGGFAVLIWFRWCRDTLDPPLDDEPEEQPAEDTDDRPGRPATTQA